MSTWIPGFCRDDLLAPSAAERTSARTSEGGAGRSGTDRLVEIDGGAVRRYRRERLLTQQQLADSCGLTSRSIKSIERHGGARMATTLQALATVLRISPSLLQPGVHASSLVGRAREIAVVEDVLGGVFAGTGHVLLVAGEAGAGKSALVEHLARRSADLGARALIGRCGEDDGAAPYRPWVQILRASATDRDLAEACARGDLGAGGPDLARLVPECFQVRAGPQPSASERYPLFDATSRWWRLCAERVPQVLVVEDLHAADRSTLQLWQFVAEEVRTARILLVGTYRHTEIDVGHPLSGAIEQLDRVPGYDRVELRGLGADEVGELASARLPGPVEPSFWAELHARTAGNPFFVQELLRHVDPAETYTASEVPKDLSPRVHDAVRARVGRLGNDRRALIECAAVLGPEFSLDLLADVAGQDANALLDAIDALVLAGVIREDARSRNAYEFSHAIFRDALYVQIPPARRAVLHRRAAETLERRAGAESLVSARAHHWIRAGLEGDPKRAYDRVVEAALEANARLAYAEAAHYWQEALGLACSAGGIPPEESCRLLLEQAHALNRAGDAAQATDVFHEAARRARLAGSVPLLTEAALGVGLRFGQITEFGSVDVRQASLLEDALEALPSTPSAERVHVLARMGTALYWSEQIDRSVALSEESVAVARQLDDPISLVVALIAKYMSLLRLETPTGRHEILSEASALLEGTHHPELRLSLDTLRLVENLDAAATSDQYKPALARHAMQAERLGQAQGRWWTSALETGLALAEGRMSDAREGAERTRELGLRSNNPNVHAAYLAHTWLPLLQERSWPALERLARASLATRPVLRCWRCLQAHALARCGAREDALFQIKEIARNDFHEIRQPGIWALSAALLAETCYLLGAQEQGRRLHELLLPHEGRNVIIGLGIGHLGPVARYLGLLDLLLGRDRAAERHLLSALRRTRGLGTHAWTVVTLLDLAALRMRSGAHDLAHEHLEDAEGLAHAVGLDALAIEARLARAQIAEKARHA